MEAVEQGHLIEQLYLAIFLRSPTPGEIARWKERLGRGAPVSEIIISLRETEEYIRKHRVKAFVPNGHYYSPVVDPATIGDYYKQELTTAPSNISAIEVNLARMELAWKRLEATLKTTNFEADQAPKKRYVRQPEGFPFADAAILRAMIGYSRPKRIVEIGSGRSTACMLDAMEEFGLDETRIDCVEPYPDRLNDLLRSQDAKTVSLHQEPVQQVGMSLFRRLQTGDILFIDSTHVVKTGSDVHFEFFHVLPVLADGVLIHFHDCPFPFEYPPQWVLEQNMSWNELYFLRAFLMYNDKFNIVFWTSLFFGAFSARVKEVDARLLSSPRSGIWIVKGPPPF